MILIVVVLKGYDFVKSEENLLSVINEILYVEIGVIGVLEIFFIILPLPVFKCFGSRQHINNILILKIKWCFMLQCLLQTIATLSYTNLGENEIVEKASKYFPVSVIAFVLLKFYVHFFGYRRVKYLDDGRDYVSIKEFFSVHATFSVLNSWVSYFTSFIVLR